VATNKTISKLGSTLLGKVLPLQVAGTEGGPIHLEVVNYAIKHRRFASAGRAELMIPLVTWRLTRRGKFER
jgi:hypothetical protein